MTCARRRGLEGQEAQPVPFPVAQWWSTRRISGRLWVRIPPGLGRAYLQAPTAGIGVGLRVPLKPRRGDVWHLRGSINRAERDVGP